ncbi:ABC transporter substrate-binding protein [Anaeromicrobium sediminis]|uniref:ABC transporter substrate-binding protein n=1 Tax=Anaeromicrobium sediminis TaxID=1478221 RepID=A0A267MA05_9FIRM|nr:ABC transporter substrate-binding protein [Anaeromicrobium sediminis]PAB55748.1 ABC transporter substrate-binding protein [Anaeromicrobium sediminis]
MKKKLRVILTILISISILFSACGSKELENGDNFRKSTWEEIEKSGQGTEVYFYGWGGDPKINSWIDDVLAKEVKDKYNITLKRVPMNIDEVLVKLLDEKNLEAEGTIDIVWINGENFFTAKENELLEGPFLEKLPNGKKYLDLNDVELNYDFGFSIDGYEAPYGKAQFVFIYDGEVVEKFPKDHEEFLQFAKVNKGKVTYPAPPDFVGSAFVRNIIYDMVGYEQFINMEPDYEVVKKEIMPAIDYFKELKPYLWREGKAYPSTMAQLENMFADGEVIITMDYNPNKASRKISDGQFKSTTKTAIFQKGSVGNTHFVAIPKNATNKEAAVLVINEIISPKMQASKYDPKVWGDLPVLDNSKLSSEEKKLFDNVVLGKATIDQSILLDNRLPEMPAKLIPIIEKIWEEEILK